MEAQLNTFSIPNDLSRRAGLGAAWLPINQIGVFPYHPLKSHSQDIPSPYSPGEASVFHLRSEVILFNPILRKLVNEANGVFLNVQKLVSANNPDFRSELLNMSRQYRSIVRACLENLQNELMQMKSSEKEEIQNYITIFYSVECIWHLCEILFIENIPGNIVIPHLLEWVRFHFPKYERRAAMLLTGDLIALESQPEYWDTVIGSLMQGRIEVVRALLRLHSSADSDHFRLADQALKSMPVYNIYNGISVNEFHLRWKHWLVDTQSKIDAKLFIAEKRLELMIGLIVGEEASWNEIQNRCEAWYELLAAWLFYTEPTIKTYELGHYAKRCISRMKYTDHLKHLDRVLIAAMDADVLHVIKEIQHMTENGWFVSHLADLLYHAGHLDILDKTEPQELLASKLRESFLLEYGTLLMGHNSLWQVGLSYLDHCSKDGPGTIELLLMRLPLTTEARALKIIKEAQQRRLCRVVQSICKLQGIMSLRRGRLGNALMWSIKSQDGIFTSYIADKYLMSYKETGVMKNIDLLDSLGPSMMASDRLIFLGKYREFHKFYNSKDFKAAGNLLISLIASKITPKYFWVTLLTDALPLLNNDSLVMSSNDTYTLLQCLEERVNYLEINDKLEEIRLAISNNLGRALIHEAQIA